MVDVFSEDESEPSAYPAKPSGLSTAATVIDKAVIWQRIEAYISHRWATRNVQWVLGGPGVWVPRLKPTTLDSAEFWNGDNWETLTLEAAPLGYDLGEAMYRVNATVGSTDDPPAAVLEAYRRLSEYLAETEGGRVASSVTHSFGDVTFEQTRPATWQAKALHYSGAADLLRRYR